MQETILAGQNGQPAVDQMTGNPLTIEELLRRRGLVAYGGNIRMTPLPGYEGGAAGTSPMQQGGAVDPAAAAAAASAMNSHEMQHAGGALASDASIPSAGGAVMPDVGGETSVTPEQAQAFEEADAATGGNGESIIEELVALGIGGAGLYAAYRAWKARRGRTTGNPADPNAGGGRAVAPTTPSGDGGGPSARVLNPESPVSGVIGDGSIVDGEFTEVRGLPAPNADSMSSADDNVDQRALPRPSQARTNATQFSGTQQYQGDEPQPRGGPRQQSRGSSRVANALSDRYTGSRRDRAQQRMQRGQRVEPNDMGPIAAGDNVPPEVRAEASRIAQELAARRAPQGSHRGRANEPRNNQMEGLVNEIARYIMNNPAAVARLRRGGR